MKIVLGLGNPGAQYQRTRHNLGFRVVDRLASGARVAFEREAGIGDVCWSAGVTIAGHDVVLAKPRTFMNRSGRAGAALLRHCDARAEDLLVVHDDADLSFGRVRLRAEGGAGGHNGLRSLITVLGTAAFPRVKLGVRGAGRDEQELADYVLADFDEDEREPAEELVREGAEAVVAVLESGLLETMNRYNGMPPVARAPGAC